MKRLNGIIVVKSIRNRLRASGLRFSPTAPTVGLIGGRRADTMGAFDVTFKSIFRRGGSAFLTQIGVPAKPRQIDTDVSSVRDRRIDFLAETTAGRLLHIEFQSSADRTMAARMLGYYADILGGLASRTRPGQRVKHKEVRQILIYAGKETWHAPAGIRHQNLTFSFDFVDLRTQPALPLLAGDPGDAILAVLCENGASPDMVERIVSRIVTSPLDARERDDALIELAILSRLRGAEASVLREVGNMGVTIDVEGSLLLREPFEQVFARGEAEATARIAGRLIRKRFDPKDIPIDLDERLSQLDANTLERVVDGVDEASSVEELLRINPPGSKIGSTG